METENLVLVNKTTAREIAMTHTVHESKLWTVDGELNDFFIGAFQASRSQLAANVGDLNMGFNMLSR